MNKDEVDEFLNRARKDEPVVKKVRFPELAPATGLQNMKINLNYFQDVQVLVTAELGGATIRARDLLDLNEGTLLELKRAAGDNVDILVNRRRLARGEVVIIGSNFGIRIERVYQPDEHKEE